MGAEERQEPGVGKALKSWLALAALLVLARLFLYGFSFGHADHYTHLPVLRHTLDPGHLAGDWYLGTLERFSVRELFFAALAPVAARLGESATFLALLLAILAAAGSALLALGRRSFGAEAAGWVALVTMIAAVGSEIGSVRLISFVARPQDVAHALVLLALASWLAHRPLGAGVALGLAFDVHPVIGAQAAALLAAVHLASRRHGLRQLARLAAAALATGLPALAVYARLTHPAGGAGGASGGESLTLLLDTYAFVLGDRIDPSAWSADAWQALAGLALAFAATAREAAARLAPEVRREARAFALGAWAVLLVAIPLAYLFPWTALFQPLRLAVWSRLAVLAAIGAWCQRRWREGGVGRVLVAAALLSLFDGTWFLVTWGAILAGQWVGPWVGRGLPLWRFGRTSPAATAGRFRAAVRACLVAAAVLLAALAAAPWSRSLPVHQRFEPAHAAAILVALALAAGLDLDLRRLSTAVPAAFGLAAVLALRAPGMPLAPEPGQWAHVQPRLVPVSDQESLAAWCRLHLPAGARLLVPPNSQAFRLFAERPVVVDVAGFPFVGADALEWRRRLLAVAGLPADVALRRLPRSRVVAGYHRLSAERLAELARELEAGFYVTSRDRELSCERLQRRGSWSVWRLPD
jgi:hypothetical protein